MTRYCQTYSLTAEEKSLLKDLLVYKIRKNASEINASNKGKYNPKNDSIYDLLIDVRKMQDNELTVCGNQMFLVHQIEELYMRSTDTIKENSTDAIDNELMIVFSKYSNETINKLRNQILSKENTAMVSTNSFHIMRDRTLRAELNKTETITFTKCSPSDKSLPSFLKRTSK